MANLNERKPDIHSRTWTLRAALVFDSRLILSSHTDENTDLMKQETLNPTETTGAVRQYWKHSV